MTAGELILFNNLCADAVRCMAEGNSATAIIRLDSARNIAAARTQKLEPAFKGEEVRVAL